MLGCAVNEEYEHFFSSFAPLSSSYCVGTHVNYFAAVLGPAEAARHTLCVQGFGLCASG